MRDLGQAEDPGCRNFHLCLNDLINFHLVQYIAFVRLGGLSYRYHHLHSPPNHRVGSLDDYDQSVPPDTI